jgi:Domain of unknown function (DUF4268)
VGAVLTLGKLEKVAVRDAWPDEARNFTPWLATEGLNLLAVELGVRLQVLKCEHPVGRYSLDILATQLSEDGTPNDHLIVIENQFGATNHDHLGKLLTYAAGVGNEFQGAKTVIWIAEDLREEHQRALQWLNEVSKSDVRFYGVQLELYKIGNSEPAPSLNVIVRPNEVVRARQDAPNLQVASDLNLFYVEYWTAFKAFCSDRGAAFTPQTPRPQQWIEAALGRTGFFLSFVATRRDKWIGCELHIRNANPAEALKILRADEKSIQSEVGPLELKWHLLQKSAKVQLVQTDIPVEDRSQWIDQHKWLFEQGEKMYSAFAQRVKQIRS